MVYRRPTRFRPRRRFRRRFRRPGAVARRIVRVPRRRFGGPRFPFGNTFRTALTYTQTLTLSGSWIRRQQFRGNGPYDPDASGVGAQPNGFDQLTPTLYAKHRCHGSRITVTYINNGTLPTEVVLLPTTNASAYPTLSDARSAPGAHYRVLAPVGSTAPTTLTAYNRTGNALGLNQGSILYDDVYLCGSTELPGNQFWWDIYTAPTDGVTASNVTITVKITYYLTFSQRVLLNLS